jgi:hypothetical protein
MDIKDINNNKDPIFNGLLAESVSVGLAKYIYKMVVEGSVPVVRSQSIVHCLAAAMTLSLHSYNVHKGVKVKLDSGTMEEVTESLFHVLRINLDEVMQDIGPTGTVILVNLMTDGEEKEENND